MFGSRRDGDGGRALALALRPRSHGSLFSFIKCNEFGSRVKTMEEKNITKQKRQANAETDGYVSDVLETQQDKGTVSKHIQQH